MATDSMPPELAHDTAQVERLARAIDGKPNAATLFSRLAEMHWRVRDLAGYAEFVRRAYLSGSDTGIMSLAGKVSLSRATATELRDRARALIDREVRHAQVIAALALAEAQLGNGEAVRALMDERFLRCGVIDLPRGKSIEDFNRALANEIKADLKFYDSPPDRSIRHAWRCDRLHRATTPAIRALMALLSQHASDYMNGLPADAAHPFIASRPSQFALSAWAVVSNGASYHKSHVHPKAWATGVYYIVQPDISRASGGDRGWLRIGPPPYLHCGASHDWTRRLIEPAPGSFVLMPAYFWHETQPMGVDQERICVAFELQAAELSESDIGMKD